MAYIYSRAKSILGGCTELIDQKPAVNYSKVE